MQPLALVISVLALATSGVTMWLTLLRRGSIKMTRPSQIHFALLPAPQILIRTLLFSTAKRGRVIESMHVTVQNDETRQNFNIWVSGEEKLSRASGLYVGESGVVVSHYFMVPHDQKHTGFSAGTYRLEVFAKLVDEDRSRSMWSQTLHITNEQGIALKEVPCGIYFDWGQEAEKYISHVALMGARDDFERQLELLRLAKEVMSMSHNQKNTGNSNTGVDNA
jgi:hypothetical protein